MTDRRAHLLERLSRLPRFSLARLPTPLDDLPRLARALDRPRILVKRDDLTGLAFGGNKTRELDFIVGEALARGANVFVAGGGAGQSNHAVQCAAAANRAGMKPILVLHRSRADEPQGNLLLSRLLGAEIHFVDTDGVDGAINRRTALEGVMRRIADDHRGRGLTPYVLPSSFHPLAAAAYAGCALELAGQLDALGLPAARVYLASAGATQVGLALGARHIGAPFRVVGIAYTADTTGLRDRMLGLARETGELLGLDTRLEDGDLTNESFAGPGYGVVTPEGREAIRLLAETEGLFLDPVYTGKGMAGLIDHVRRGIVPRDEAIVFLHTGGLPALFSYNREMVPATP